LAGQTIHDIAGVVDWRQDVFGAEGEQKRMTPTGDLSKICLKHPKNHSKAGK
jgi:hypothetical protein